MEHRSRIEISSLILEAANGGGYVLERPR